jgi:hypothetical protein
MDSISTLCASNLFASLPVEPLSLIRAPNHLQRHTRTLTDLSVWCFRCASMFSVALLAALSAQSGRLLEPSSLSPIIQKYCDSRFKKRAAKVHVSARRDLRLGSGQHPRNVNHVNGKTRLTSSYNIQPAMKHVFLTIEQTIMMVPVVYLCFFFWGGGGSGQARNFPKSVTLTTSPSDRQ